MEKKTLFLLDEQELSKFIRDSNSMEGKDSIHYYLNALDDEEEYAMNPKRKYY